jgi:hypothetical protein
MRWTVALLFTLAFAFPGAGQAAPREGNIAALARPLASPRQKIVGGVLWKCAGGRCAAPSDGSRPVLTCRRVAKAFGPVASFTTPGGTLSNEDLSRCNAGS